MRNSFLLHFVDDILHINVIPDDGKEDCEYDTVSKIIFSLLVVSLTTCVYCTKCYYGVFQDCNSDRHTTGQMPSKNDNPTSCV